MSDRDTIYALVKQHLHKVKRSGPDNIMASCPFHQSDDPHGSTTFSMSMSRGIFYCFSCTASGSLKDFLKGIGVPPYEVGTLYAPLIERMRLNAPPPKSVHKFDPHSNELLPENLLGLFDYCPIRLRDVGFQEQTLQHFDIGYDFYHNRITFPLRDVDGQLVGISGRRTEGDGPRFKIYKEEYKVWGLPARQQVDRGVLLWNIHRAGPECILTQRPIILVEGFKACMWVWQAGFTNVVALLGNRVTVEQKWMLDHLGVPVILMLDGDEAGREGTVRSGLTLAKSMSVKVTRLPEHEQPNDLTVEQLNRQLDDSTIFQLWLAKQPRRTSWKEDRRTAH